MVSPDERKQEVDKVRAKYPDRVPIICEKYGMLTPSIERKKFLVQGDLSIGHFQHCVRRMLREKIKPDKGIFLYWGSQGNMAPNAALVQIVYNEEKDEDGYLYVRYCTENIFGRS